MVVIDKHEFLCQEEQRLKQDREKNKYWKKWGPYTAERQWATGKPLYTCSRCVMLTPVHQSARITREYLAMISTPFACRTLTLLDEA